MDIIMRTSLSQSLICTASAFLALIFLASCGGRAANVVTLESNKEAVVVLHGLGRSPAAMSKLASRLEDAGYQVVAVEYDSLDDTPEEILEDVGQQIRSCCLGKTSQLHFVGHSLGGLVARSYLMENDVPNLGKVVLLGTPSRGSVLVDKNREKWWFSLLGPTANMLGTDDNSFPNGLEQPYYPLGVIAGLKDSDNEDLLPGQDDGLISVSSTKVNGMTDFIIVNSGHSAMRDNEDVAKLTIRFLQAGHF
ncbi:MAG: alpha/beta fold hydrolase [Pseudomonadota bacterium]